jgi:hypothetical protein
MCRIGMRVVAAPLGDDLMWESIDFKVEEANFFLDEMSRDLVPPEHRPDATPQLRAIPMSSLSPADGVALTKRMRSSTSRPK